MPIQLDFRRYKVLFTQIMLFSFLIACTFDAEIQRPSPTIDQASVPTQETSVFDVETVTTSNVDTVIYEFIDKQSKLCTVDRNLSDEEWSEFQEWLKNLDFQEFISPEKEDLESYRDEFVQLLSTPDANEGDCGYELGELYPYTMAILVDFGITKQKAVKDGQSQELVEDLERFLDLTKAIHFVALDTNGPPLLDIDTDQLEAAPLEKRMFFEYLLIWWGLGQEERTNSTIRAQASLLGMTPDVVDDPDVREQFESLHVSMALTSRALTRGEEGVMEIGILSLGHFAKLIPLIDVTPQDAKNIGGEFLFNVFQSIQSLDIE